MSSFHSLEIILVADGRSLAARPRLNWEIRSRWSRKNKLYAVRARLGLGTGVKAADLLGIVGHVSREKDKNGVDANEDNRGD